MAKKADVRVQNEGTIFLFHIDTEAAEAWIEEHCAGLEDWQWVNGALVVEHRYARDLAIGMSNDGLEVI